MTDDLIEKHEDSGWELQFQFGEDFDQENPEGLKLLDMFSAKRLHIPRLLFDRDSDPLYKESKALCGNVDRSVVRTPAEVKENDRYSLVLCGSCARSLTSKLPEGVEARDLVKALAENEELQEYLMEVKALQ